MSNRREKPIGVDAPSLSKSSQASIFKLIEKCIHFQRRLETALLYLTDSPTLHRTSNCLHDLRSYRRVLVENLVEDYEPDIILESIRICEKAMLLIASSTDEICLIAGSECTY